MSQSYCPFKVIHHLLTCTVGIHAVCEQTSDAIDPNIAEQINESLVRAGHHWIKDLSKAISKTPNRKTGQATLYADIVKNISLAHTLISQLYEAGAPLPPAIAAELEKSQVAARYYVEHRETIRTTLQSDPESKAKLLAYFGDMLAEG